VVVLHADPGGWLQVTLRGWPVPSESGEALLLHRDADRALYLG
jgi:hypothetical protein